MKENAEGTKWNYGGPNGKKLTEKTAIIENLIVVDNKKGSKLKL